MQSPAKQKLIHKWWQKTKNSHKQITTSWQPGKLSPLQRDASQMTSLSGALLFGEISSYWQSACIYWPVCTSDCSQSKSDVFGDRLPSTRCPVQHMGNTGLQAKVLPRGLNHVVTFGCSNYLYLITESKKHKTQSLGNHQLFLVSRRSPPFFYSSVTKP